MRVAVMLALASTFAWCSKSARPSGSVEVDAASPAVTTEADAAALDGAELDAGEATDEAAEAAVVPEDGAGQAIPIPRKDAPALRYGAMSRAACDAELVKRKIPFARAEPTSGVRSPIRLTGPLHGVTIHSASSPRKQAKATYEIFECRLVLALDDFAELAAKKDVVEMQHMSAFRSFKQRGCLSKGSKQHCGALAVDIGTFTKSDGTKLVVDRDFHGKIGQGTCIASAKPAPSSPESEELWSYVCEAARRTLFNVILTPNFNAAHHNHFHLEVTPGAKWMLVH